MKIRIKPTSDRLVGFSADHPNETFAAELTGLIDHAKEANIAIKESYDVYTLWPNQSDYTVWITEGIESD